MSTSTRLFAFVFVTALVAHAPRASAQSAAPQSEADTLVDQGIALRRSGNDAGALALFERAYASDHSMRSLAQIGLAEQALGRWSSAHEHLHDALSHHGDGWIDRNRAALEQSLAVIDRHLGTLDVLVNVNGAEVLIDGTSVGTTPLREPLRLPSGSVLVAVRAHGYIGQHRNVEIENGALTRETFTLAPRTGTAGEVEDQATTSSSAPQHIGAQRGPSAGPFVVAGIGVVAILTASILFAVRDSLVSGCTIGANEIDCPTMASYNSAMTAESVNAAIPWVYVGGAVVVAGGVAWAVVDWMQRSHERQAVRVHVTPFASGAMIGVGGAF